MAEERGAERAKAGEEQPREERFGWGEQDDLTYYDEKGNVVSREEWEAGVSRNSRKRAEDRAEDEGHGA